MYQFTVHLSPNFTTNNIFIFLIQRYAALLRIKKRDNLLFQFQFTFVLGCWVLGTWITVYLQFDDHKSQTSCGFITFTGVYEFLSRYACGSRKPKSAYRCTISKACCAIKIPIAPTTFSFPAVSLSRFGTRSSQLWTLPCQSTQEDC
jgi:hypothetical protein